jgi:UDP-glucose 4-epimerase
VPRGQRAECDQVSVLVTGSAGLVGAAVCRRLNHEGIPFTAVWRTTKPDEAWRLDAPLIQADLSDADALTAVDGVTGVVHAAAALPSSFAGSEREAAVNRRVDDRVLELARGWRVPIVYVSGTSLYRPQGASSLDESAAIAPVGAYLEEKARTEQLGLQQSDAPFTALRVSAPYGSRQRARTVIQLFLERAVAGRPLEYYGTGSREQDFTWADDIGAAITLALRGPGGVFNIATGRPVTMRELAETVAAVAGLPPGAVRAAGREDPQEGATARFDVGAAARELGWTAATTLDAGIARLLGELR